MRNVIDTLAIGMGGIFLQCHVVARFCNAMSSLFADAMIGQSLIFRRGDRPTPCRTRAEASRAQASFAPNSAGRKLDPIPTDCCCCGLVGYSSSSSFFTRAFACSSRASLWTTPFASTTTTASGRRTGSPSSRVRFPSARLPSPLGRSMLNSVSTDHVPSSPAVNL